MSSSFDVERKTFLYKGNNHRKQLTKKPNDTYTRSEKITREFAPLSYRLLGKEETSKEGRILSEVGPRKDGWAVLPLSRLCIDCEKGPSQSSDVVMTTVSRALSTPTGWLVCLACVCGERGERKAARRKKRIV